MTVLSRYLVRQNLFLLSTTLLAGTGLYLLTDLFERLDDFLVSGTGLLTPLVYFLVKTPTIISLILPAVYLLSLVIQLNILERNRELIALAAGGVRPVTLVRFILGYGIVWALGQLVFAQVVGVSGERMAARIWQEDVRGNVMENASIRGLWFTERNHVVHIGLVYPVQKKGVDILIYSLNTNGTRIEEIIKAKSFVVEKENQWILKDGNRLIPQEYSTTVFDTLAVALQQDLRAFQVGARSSIRPSQLSLQELEQIIVRLETAGSNVEVLRTAWHGKISYAASLVIMSLLALIVSRVTSGIYKAVFLSLIIIFLYFSINTLCASMGQKGILSPLAGAWFANAIFCLASGLWLVWPWITRHLRQ